MKLVKKILERLNGLHYSQEYLCLAKESFQQPLHAYLVEKGKPIKDITNSHLFVGYSPLVFALSSTAGVSEYQTSIVIALCTRLLYHDLDFQGDNIIALLSLKRAHQQIINNELLFYYEGVHGSHHFISIFHQWIGKAANNLYNHKPGNVFLESNLYKQVQIAYSLPRKICLITIGSGSLYNLFPTDLHGQVNEDYYVISLRHEGAACKQVETAAKIVLSDIQASAYKQVYALGKNHMQPLKEITAFNFSANFSRKFQLPLPNEIVCYKELQLQESFIHGIHKLLLFRIIYNEQTKEEPATLAHIHNSYATWRYKKGLQSNYLLR